MHELTLVVAILGAFIFDPAPDPATVSLTLTSPQNGLHVRAGTVVTWSISVSADGNGLGLAGISVNLVHDPSNPASVTLTSGTRGSSDFANFDRPNGICNPGPSGSGFGGTPVTAGGFTDLAEIGGAQNTFGVSGGSIGQSTTVATGIGQSGVVTLATGSFSAPFTAGVYTYQLGSAAATALSSVGVAPDPSFVEPAIVELGQSSFSFEVCCYPNCDCSTVAPILNVADFTCFLQAFTSTNPYANCDQSTVSPVLNVADFACFLQKFSAGCGGTPYGACCINYVCSYVSDQSCAASGGTFNSGLLCNMVDCDPGGACCIPGVGCMDTTQSGCAAQPNGVFHVAEACEDNPC